MFPRENLKMKKIILASLLTFASAVFASGQTAEVKMSFSEQFFDALLEAMFTNLQEPSLPLSFNSDRSVNESGETKDGDFVPFADRRGPRDTAGSIACDESVRLKREIDGVRTAVRFRAGKIYAPIAFLGNYNPPLIGCIEFQGWAETNIELAFDQKKNALVGNARVLNVNLSGTGGVGSKLIAGMVQNSIDRKINPIEIVTLDKLSFSLPVRQSGTLKMVARGIRQEVKDGSLDVYVKYEFQKGG